MNAGRTAAGPAVTAPPGGQLPALPALAVAFVRDGRLPPGAAEAACEAGDAGGGALVIGSGADAAAQVLSDLVGGTVLVGAAETGHGFRPGLLAAALAPLCAATPLVVMPASADGRDLAPRLAATLGRPLVARAVRVVLATPDPTPDPDSGGAGAPPSAATATSVRIVAEVARVDDRVLVPVTVEGPAVVTLVPGSRAVAPIGGTPAVTVRAGVGPVVPVVLDDTAGVPDVEAGTLLPPDPATMDLADATRVLGGGAGLVPPGTDDATARLAFELLGAVATALGASAGATRVATDAGWIGHDRQIGTTGVAVDPELYVAFGISGASQHVGGLGHPAHVASVNTDPSCPMTSMAGLGVVADALGTLVALARRLGVAVPETVAARAGATPGGGKGTGRG
ncbi:MAG: mycofactocin-associated electron transfer flavoprotein alpha subunit [Actinomycetota bacterium]|nr:mycofactocin-associated electron transfer flavoprotein alpha subunit [Actinomycetota bacterium]